MVECVICGELSEFAKYLEVSMVGKTAEDAQVQNWKLFWLTLGGLYGPVVRTSNDAEVSARPIPPAPYSRVSVTYDWDVEGDYMKHFFVSFGTDEEEGVSQTWWVASLTAVTGPGRSAGAVVSREGQGLLTEGEILELDAELRSRLDDVVYQS